MKQVAVSLTLGLVAVLAMVILLGWFAPGQAELRTEKAVIQLEQTRALAPLWLTVKRILIATLGALGLGVGLLALAVGLVAALSVPNGVRWTWLRSWMVRPSSHGAMYPTLAAPDGQGHVRVLDPVNERGAQRVAALTTGLQPDARLSGSAVRQALLPPKDEAAMLPESDEPAVDVEPAQTALAIDPIEKPHWLIVGQTGSGKSTATRYIMAQLAERHRVEFVICEPGGIDWNNAASAVNRDGIADAIQAVYGEFDRRQQILRAADVAHISQLPGGESLPYVYLVVEEMEAVLDDLKVTDRSRAQETLINLRQIARMGRKPGIGLIAVTQAARTDVFDSHVRTNLANVLLFRNGQGTAEMFRVGDRVTLPALPTGECYSLAHGHRLTFPLVPRPVVPLSPLYKEPGTGTVLELQEPGSEAAFAASIPVPVPVPAGPEATASPLRIESRRRPTPIEARAMRAHYRRTHSKTAVCHAFYGYKNDDVWAWVDQALRGDI